MASVQYGTIAIAAASATGTATITSVDTAKSNVMLLGMSDADAGGDHTQTHSRVRVALTNATTVTATRVGTDQEVNVSFIVITWSSSASVQQGTIVIADTAASNTATISSVDTAKAILFNNGYSIGTNDQNYSGNFVRVTLTDDTTITATRGLTSGALTVSYVIVDF